MSDQQRGDGLSGDRLGVLPAFVPAETEVWSLSRRRWSCSSSPAARGPQTGVGRQEGVCCATLNRCFDNTVAGLNVSASSPLQPLMDERQMIIVIIVIIF